MIAEALTPGIKEIIKKRLHGVYYISDAEQPFYAMVSAGSYWKAGNIDVLKGNGWKGLEIKLLSQAGVDSLLYKGEVEIDHGRFSPKTFRKYATGQ